ncbi:universal stress protein UspA [Nocardioides sp. Root1257]|uniref:universal stress protein n=1 Tax=unclassified Nocardioides TaxID=2615069 RepID=UPI0006FB6563|nr:MULTISPECIES: universal stress protein [unclassified Nocardioides]KQW47977.1 universal stress protein UspA [Nocardioides sp. Root1257]KRC45229.1 universal stress protein UspA [Nocardioides sp. Root224]
MATTSGRTVIVGHDGSPTAGLALAWALDYAARCGARVRVIRSWSLSTAPRPASMTRGYVPPLEDFEEAVLQALRADVDATVAEQAADVEVACEAVRAAAANALIEASREADLVVVGARGLGGFKGLALGSVSEQCVRHAGCPVVVVRDEHSADIDRLRESDDLIGE